MAKNSLKDKVEDGELDLSMMQYTDIPVKEIEQLGSRVVNINLSHNLLSSIPANFPLLINVTKLDLSKNMLVDLPDNFGQLKNLKWLDLYCNKLTRLPVSFAQLKNLRWLDLKDNNLVPALQQAAGPCITPNDCAMAAKKVVALLQSMESQLIRERGRKMAEEKAAADERSRKEEMERERVHKEKRAAKERRREEQKQREEDRKRELEGTMQINDGSSRNGRATPVREANGHTCHDNPGAEAPSSWCYTLLMFILGLGVAGMGLAISMVWIYTEGKLDANSIQTALPLIQQDLEEHLSPIGVTVKVFWKQGGITLRRAAKYAEHNYGETFSNIWAKLLPYLESAWAWSKPYFHQLGKVIISFCLDAWELANNMAPTYMDFLAGLVETLVKGLTQAWNSVIQAF